MNQVQVKSADVIKLILQFLKENNLVDSFETLQRQSRISLNILNTNNFISAVMKDKWDEVLLMLNSLMLNQEHLFNVYELMLDDLIEHDRYQAAEHIIKTFVQKNIKNGQNFRERLMKVQYIIQNPHEKALHKKLVTPQRKEEVIRQCLYDVTQQVEPSRLLTLLTQAIKFQSSEGTIKPSIKLDLFEGKQKVVTQEQETIIKSVEKVVKYQQDARISSIALSWGQELLALGGADGLIQIYNTIDYSFHTGLKFQAEGTALFHDTAVSLMQFNHSDEMLVSVDSSRVVKIWNLDNGKLLRSIQMDNGVGTVCWGMDPSHLAIGYQDIKLYGVRSKTILKEYLLSVHNDFINSLLISQSRIYAATNSGILKVFNYNTQQELISTNLRHRIIQVLPLYSSRLGSHSLNRLLVLTQQKIYELNTKGQEETRYEVEGSSQLLQAGCTGEYLYMFIKDQKQGNKMNVISRTDHKNVFYCRVEEQTTFCRVQRQKNLMITYDNQDQLKFWRQLN